MGQRMRWVAVSIVITVLVGYPIYHWGRSDGKSSLRGEGPTINRTSSGKDSFLASFFSFLFEGASLAESKPLAIEKGSNLGLTSEQQAYQPPERLRLRMVSDSRKTSWDARRFSSSEWLAIEVDEQGSVTARSDFSEEVVDLTDQLNRADLVTGTYVVSDASQFLEHYGERVYTFRIGINDSWSMFALLWQRNKPVQVIPLHNYGITDVALQYFYDGPNRYLVGAFLKKSERGLAILTYDEKSGKRLEYLLPSEIIAVNEIGFGSDYSEKTVYLRSVLGAPSESGLFVFKLDWERETLEQGGPLGLWEEKYVVKWHLDGDVQFSYLIGRVGNTLLVLADDGRIGGQHENNYLYGVDANTGRRAWTVAGGNQPLDFFLSSDREHAAVLTRRSQEAKLVWMNVHSGRVVWEKTFLVKGTNDLRIAGAAGAVLVQGKPEGKSGNLSALDSATGEALWEKSMEENEELAVWSHETPLAVVVSPQGITGYGSRTGQVKWQVKEPMDIRSITVHPFYNPSLTSDWRPSAGWITRPAAWFVTKNALLRIDLRTGKTLASVENSPNRHFTVLGGRYLFIHEMEDAGEYAQYAYRRGIGVKTSFYDLEDHKELWKINDDAVTGIVEGQQVYYVTRGRIVSADLLTGRVRWETPFQRHEHWEGKQPVIANDNLFVPGLKGVFAFDKTTGTYRYQVADYQIDSLEGRTLLNTYGLLTRMGDALYVGSADGRFSKLDLEQTPAGKAAREVRNLGSGQQ